MTVSSHQHVTAKHLARSAFLYVRQSTLKQVCENTESTRRQYALRQRAVRRARFGSVRGRSRKASCVFRLGERQMSSYPPSFAARLNLPDSAIVHVMGGPQD